MHEPKINFQESISLERLVYDFGYFHRIWHGLLKIVLFACLMVFYREVFWSEDSISMNITSLLLSVPSYVFIRIFIYNANIRNDGLVRVRGKSLTANRKLVKDILMEMNYQANNHNKNCTCALAKSAYNLLNWDRAITILYDKSDILINCRTRTYTLYNNFLSWFTNRKIEKKFILKLEEAIEKSGENVQVQADALKPEHSFMYDRKILTYYAAIALSFVLLILWLFPNIQYYGRYIAYISETILLVGILFSGFGGLFFLYLTIKNEPMLTVSKKGLQVNQIPWKRQFIHWFEIKRIYVNGNFIHIRKHGKTSRLKSKKNEHSFYLLMTLENHKQIKDTIMAYKDAYDQQSASEQRDN